jgi:hypothetical protein
MPSNNNNQRQQQQRSNAGAKVLKPKKDVGINELRRLENQLDKAADIEAQLGALMNKKAPSDDDKSYKLRSHLCEVLSDILISNPKMSLDKDCFQRLWRGCFYNPIKIWRQRVSREKRKRSPSLTATQQGFKHFLSEAVTLYDYLVLQYLTKLIPSTTQQDMTQQSRDSLFSATNDRSQLEDTQYASQSTGIDSFSSETVVSAGSPLDGVVQGLYKLYIFLGDLHRYAEAYNKAEENYRNASKLGPGLGNPYNQLAVVAFSKDTYCVALYWYARSLLATHEKFSTSSNNLERLFASNREFLLEHGRDSMPIVFQNSTNNNTCGTSSKNKNRNSANVNMLRAQKTAATKSCLTYFVDLHYDLFQQEEKNKKEQNNTSDGSSDNVNGDRDREAKRLREKMNNVIASLKSLIQVSGFSDGLLCKIVIINSFSLQHASSAASANSSSKSTISKALAKDYLFSLGIVLAEQVEKLLVKSLEKAAPNKPAPSVRCLLPFEMLLDCVAMCLQEESNNVKKNCDDDDDDAASIEIEFWKRVSAVGNLVRKTLKSYKVSVAGIEGATSRGSRHRKYLTQIKEYKLLKGYRPFRIVNEEYLSKKDGFLDAMEAVDVLELSTTQSASQDTGAVSAVTEDGSIGGGGMKENKAKLLLMLDLCEHLALPTSVAPLTSENGDYVYQEKNPVLTYKNVLENGDVHEEENSDGGGNFADDSEDDASDIIVYHETEDIANNEADLASDPSRDTIPPTSSASTEYKVEEPPQDRDAIMTATEEQSPYPVSTVPVKPPPGFGGPTTVPPTSRQTTSVLAHNEPLMAHHLTSIGQNPTIDLPGLPSPPKNRSILDQVIHGRIPTADSSSSSSSFQLPPQQNHSMLPISGYSQNPMENEMLYPLQTGRSNLPNSVEESIRIFGDMNTTNPFAVNPPPSAFSIPINNHQNQNNNQNSSIIPDYAAHDTFTADDTKWLNTNLLNSLWMSESSNTKNA